MKSAMTLRIVTAVLLLAGCGGKSSAVAPSSSWPSVAGTWNGVLRTASGEAAGTVRMTIKQPNNFGQLQVILGSWTAESASHADSGSFNGGVAQNGQVLFTLDQFGRQWCNIAVTASAGNPITGTFSHDLPPDCTAWLPKTGLIELTRE